MANLGHDALKAVHNKEYEVIFLGSGKAEIIQPACFGAGCYIEMATSYHQPHEYELVGG